VAIQHCVYRKKKRSEKGKIGRRGKDVLQAYRQTAGGPLSKTYRGKLQRKNYGKNSTDRRDNPGMGWEGNRLNKKVEIICVRTGTKKPFFTRATGGGWENRGREKGVKPKKGDLAKQRTSGPYRRAEIRGKGGGRKERGHARA